MITKNDRQEEMEDVKKDSQAIILYVKHLLSTIKEVTTGSIVRKGKGRRQKLFNYTTDEEEESKCHGVNDFKVDSRLNRH